MECPKCHFKRNVQDMECPRCGIIYDKYELMLKKKEENDNRQQSNQGLNPADNQNKTSLNAFNKLKYYLGGIMMGIITAVLIISYFTSKIDRLIASQNLNTTSYGSIQATSPDEYGPAVQDESQDSSMNLEAPQSAALSITANENREKLSGSINVIEDACKAVVTIKTAAGFGSGFFINDDGYILTNKHVSKMNENAQQTLYDARESVRDQLKEKEDLLSDIKSRLDDKQTQIDTEDAWISENTENRYYSRPELEKKVAEVNSHRAQLQNHVREYNILMNQYNREKATATLLEQRHEQINSQISKLALNTSITVYMADGTKKTASIISNSYTHDMALLKIYGVNTPFISPADIERVRVGDTLYAIGTPHDLSLNQTVTSGILSGFRDGLIQTNAQISGGNSGGPLINDEGKAIGINTSKIVADGVEGIGFAIPINVVLQEYNQYFY